MEGTISAVNPPRQGHPRFYEILDQMAELHAAKNHDYAGAKDPLSNLRECEGMGVPAWVGVLIRLSDKFSRLKSYAAKREFKVKGEGLVDTLMDNAIYSILAIVLFEEAERDQSWANAAAFDAIAGAVSDDDLHYDPNDPWSDNGVLTIVDAEGNHPAGLKAGDKIHVTARGIDRRDDGFTYVAPREIEVGDEVRVLDSVIDPVSQRAYLGRVFVVAEVHDWEGPWYSLHGVSVNMRHDEVELIP